MKLEQIQAKIKQLIRNYGTRDPYKLCKKIGINLYFSNNLKEVLGMFCQQHRIKSIFLNDNLSYEIQRLVLAHELGHAILHSRTLNTDIFQQEQLHQLRLKVITTTEKEANFFAAYLLLDTHAVLEQLQNGYSLESLAQANSVTVELMAYFLSCLAEFNELNENNLQLNQYQTMNFWQRLV